MLKVINYDGFYKDLNEWVTEEDKRLPPNKNWYVSVLITAEDNEIKAIPIEWIEKWISERNDFPTMPYNQHIRNMLEDWEKENEID